MDLVELKGKNVLKSDENDKSNCFGVTVSKDINIFESFASKVISLKISVTL